MNCDDTRLLMQEYFDDTSHFELGEKIQEHLHTCTSCSQHFSQFEQLDHRLRDLHWYRAPSGFTDLLMKQLPEVPVKPAPKTDWRYTAMKGMGIAASILFCIGIGVWGAIPQGFSVSASNSDIKGLVIRNHTVVVPKGEEYHGDLVVQNGDAKILGKVDGSVTALGGRIYQNTSDNISGNREEVEAGYQWVRYYVGRIWRALLADMSQK